MGRSKFRTAFCEKRKNYKIKFKSPLQQLDNIRKNTRTRKNAIAYALFNAYTLYTKNDAYNILEYYWYFQEISSQK